MKPRTKCLTMAAALAALLPLAAARSVAAATLTVTSTADDGPGTLRAALAVAADGDTIAFALTPLPATIALVSGELSVDKSVTVTGPGQGQLTVDGHSATRVFFVWSDVTVPTVTISGLTIANGKSNTTGGGVYNGGTLTLRDCTLSGNYAREGGGGVYTANGSLVITRCTLSGNTSYFSPENCYGGGAVAFLAEGSSPTLTIEDSLLINNTAPYGGGIIIYAEGDADHPAHPTVTITDSTLSDNTAASDNGFGGGIAVSVDGYFNPETASATVTVENSTLSGNSAVGDSMAMGGAIANLTYGGDATLTITNSTLNGNNSSLFGGALVNNGTLNLVNSTLNGNSGSGGGAVLTLGALTLTDCALNGNAAAEMGGAIMSGFLDARFDTTLTITRCTLNNNTVATNGFGGGAIMNLGVGATASLIIADSTLSANSAPGGGAILTAGAVYYEGEFEGDPEFPGTATVNIRNSTLSGNSAQNGGGIANWKGRQDCSATLTVDNSTLSGNWADGTFDGAIANLGGLVGIKNTILAASPTGTNLWNDGDSGGTIESFGSNLCTDGGGGFLTAAGDWVNTDPRLGLLADNGGPTWTCALLVGSLAIDAASPTDSAGNPVTTDQRGVARPQRGANDIGAFEASAATPYAQLAQVRDELADTVLPALVPSDKTRLQDALNHLNKALEASRWLDASHTKPGAKGESVFDETKSAVVKLRELRDRNKSAVAREVFQAYIDRILAADRELAAIAIDEAKARGGNAGKIRTAETELSKGDVEVGLGHPDKAIDRYKNSWKNAIAA